MDYKGYDIEIMPDDSAESPRENDNLGVMTCGHRRYNLGDKAHAVKFGEFESWDALKKHLIAEGAVIVLPLYLYDHSGLRIKVGSFAGLLPEGHAEFDSGMVGFVYATREKVLAEYGGKILSAKKLARARGVLECEVACYDTWLRGGYVGFVIEKDGEHVDSCWGIDDPDYALREAKGVVDSLVEKAA